MSILTVAAVSHYFGADQILDDISFRIERNEHVALVGSNGAGKSTLLRIIARLEAPDSGHVSYASGTRVAYLAQEPHFAPEQTLFEGVLEVFRPVMQAHQRLRDLEKAMASGEASEEDVIEYGELLSHVEHHGYDFEERVEQVLLGLGLECEHWQTPTAQLSGGQRTRANLGRTLLEEADVLLLDEPSNHLDIPALEWLEKYLAKLDHAFLIVAHDRYLLDRVTTRTLELLGRRIYDYPGAYSRYLELKKERVERQRLEYEAQQEHIAKTEDFIRRYGAGQRSKEARGRQKRLDRLERVEKPREEETVRLQLKRASRSGDIALTLRRLIVGYEGRPLVQLPDEVIVTRGERVGIIGPNGSGKTTLLRTLLGKLDPLAGAVRWGSRTSLGYYSQTLAHLDDRLTPLDEVRRVRAMDEDEGRSFLGRFLFSGDDVFKTVAMLSGGEKSRVALAKLILEEPNVLVLDEPTNHLDIASRGALRDVLSEFAGTLLFVSHDRYLLDHLAEELWVVRDERLMRFAGGYSAFAKGVSRPLDREDAYSRSRQPKRTERPLDELEEEAMRVAQDLATSSGTMRASTLEESMARYGELLEEIEAAKDTWEEDLQRHAPVSSA